MNQDNETLKEPSLYQLGARRRVPRLKTEKEAYLFSVSLVKDSGAPPLPKEKIDSPQSALSVFRGFFEGADREKFVALFLNCRCEIIGLNVVSVGTLSASLVHPREVFKAAILAGAASLIVAHNHPSGDVAPSAEDKETTKRLKDAGKLLGIPIMDHLVISEQEFFSFKEHGLLD